MLHKIGALFAVLLAQLAPYGATAIDSATGCALAAAESPDPRTATCVACHGRGVGAAPCDHRVDVDYAAIQASRRGGMPMRRADEVVARGVFLPDGQVRCLTCHDARSPWKYHLALPPGAKAGPAVDPRDPATYQDGPAREALRAALQVKAAGGERPAISQKPLCLACHAAD